MRRQRGPRIRERYKQSVTGCIHNVTALSSNGSLQQPSMVIEQRRIGVPQPSEESGRALDVGEEECDGASR